MGVYQGKKKRGERKGKGFIEKSHQKGDKGSTGLRFTYHVGTAKKKEVSFKLVL